MIERLNPTFFYNAPNAYVADLKLLEKINEIIDATNKLSDRQSSDAMAHALSEAPDGRLR